VPLIALLVVAVFGVTRVLNRPPSVRELQLALVQPSIPQELIFDRREDAGRFSKIMDLSRLALSGKPDVLVWPEAALPSFTEENFRAVTNLITAHNVWMIFGADDAERHATPEAPDRYDYFNSAFLFDPRGRHVATYRKQRLVIFGEYVPLTRWLPFLKHLTPIQGGFTPGAGPVPFRITEPPVNLSVLICFEDVFGQFARRHVNDDTDILLNLTNDGWFGQSAAQWQQAANATFRAVENGVPLIRCTNNGLTCWIDAHGRMMQICQSPDGDVYAAGFLTAKVPLPQAGQGNTPTVYRRHGDWFAWGCLVVSAICILNRVARKARPTA
jgi:apolipoprotein N-acyltransferase